MTQLGWCSKKGQWTLEGYALLILFTHWEPNSQLLHFVVVVTMTVGCMKDSQGGNGKCNGTYGTNLKMHWDYLSKFEY